MKALEPIGELIESVSFVPKRLRTVGEIIYDGVWLHDDPIIKEYIASM